MLTEHGVPIAPSGYYAVKISPPCARTVRDAEVLAAIERIYHDPQHSRGLYGSWKVWAKLARDGGVDGRPVPR
jgi:putative transposase